VLTGVPAPSTSHQRSFAKRTQHVHRSTRTPKVICQGLTGKTGTTFHSEERSPMAPVVGGTCDRQRRFRCISACGIRHGRRQRQDGADASVIYVRAGGRGREMRKPSTRKFR